MKLRPINDKVVVQQREAEKVSQGGIVIAGQTEKPTKGDVIAVGPGRYLGDVFIKNTLNIGDIVLFGKNAGEEVKIDDDTTYIVMREREVLAVVNE